ncbi:hotdog family protein [Nocardioides terrisoli]|uniref:hypothetical protein n=1 Tax=Nocardioides terrisoli TaxID=3388267 RepID=UPI00287B6ABF|nr:hypothetical protein [Nocardioides marmorisolisilvae]
MSEPDTFVLPDGFVFTVRSVGRTITEGDFSAMTNLTWTFEEIHTNRIHVEQTMHHERMLAGACIVAFALGIATPAIKPPLKERGVRLIALVGYEGIRFRSPLFPGDTIYVDSALLRILRTSKSDRGVICFHDAVSDHEGRVIAEYERRALCDVSVARLDGRSTL